MLLDYRIKYCSVMAMVIWKLFLFLSLVEPVFSTLKVLTIGDFGDDVPSGIVNQERVAVAMSNWCGARGCDFIVSTGDNFYNNGVTSVDDPRFDSSWRDMYNKPNIDTLVWYMSLGNHDFGTADQRELFQVEFALTEPRWYLPWLWYDFIAVDGDTTVHFIIIDAMSILLPRYEWEEQIQWYNDTLSGSTADWKVVIEHYPLYTAGGYATGSIIHRNALGAISEEYGLDFFLSGHDHNLQHIAKRDPNRDIDYIVTGAGARALYDINERGNETLSENGFDVKYFGYVYGFVVLEFDKQSASAEFIDADGVMQYSFIREH